MEAFDLVSKERVDTLRTACRSWRQSSGCRGPRTRSGYWDLRPPAAAGGRPGSMYRLREACKSTPEPLRHRRPYVDRVCLVGAGHPRCSRPARSRRVHSWYPLWQLEEELYPAARRRHQVVEVLHFMCGEIIPRWVLCPRRAHLLASTLPAVARATAACFVRCEWVV
eukprot:scaffold19167_cov61-Phaeocystis_antarctica.AAC.1